MYMYIDTYVVFHFNTLRQDYILLIS